MSNEKYVDEIRQIVLQNVSNVEEGNKIMKLVKQQIRQAQLDVLEDVGHFVTIHHFDDESQSFTSKDSAEIADYIDYKINQLKEGK